MPPATARSSNGLIAEEVAKVYPDLVAYDRDGQPYSVRYQYLAVAFEISLSQLFRSV